MYEFIPQKNIKTAQKIIILLFAGAAVLMLVTMTWEGIPYKWLFQLIALALMTAAIFMTTRYVSKTFIYRVESDGDGGSDLTVTECAAGGKRQVTVCRVSVYGIRECHLLDMSDGGGSERKLKEIRQRYGKIFDYTADLQPNKSILLVVDECGQRLSIRLSYDDRLFDILKSCEKGSEDGDEE